MFQSNTVGGSSVPPQLCIYCIVSTTVTVTLSSCSHCELLRCKSSAGRISWFILHIFLFFNAEENTTIWHLPCSRHTGTYGTSIEGPACTEFIHCQTCTFSGLNVNAAPDGNKAGNKVNTAFNASPIRNAEARIWGRATPINALCPHLSADTRAVISDARQTMRQACAVTLPQGESSSPVLANRCAAHSQQLYLPTVALWETEFSLWTTMVAAREDRKWQQEKGEGCLKTVHTWVQYLPPKTSQQPTPAGLSWCGKVGFN